MSNVTLAAVLKRLGRNDITVHGFRSTFRDWAEEATHFSREVIEAALAHRLRDKTEAADARGDLLVKRRPLMTAWASFITAQIFVLRLRECFAALRDSRHKTQW